VTAAPATATMARSTGCPKSALTRPPPRHPHEHRPGHYVPARQRAFCPSRRLRLASEFPDAGDDPVNGADPSGQDWLPSVGGGASCPPSTTPTAPTLTANSTPSQWSLAILSGLGFATERLDVFAVDAWEEAEHSTDWYDSPQTNNPLDTSENCCAWTSESSHHIKSYPTPADGLKATLLTLEQTWAFGPLKHVFSRGDADPGQGLYDLLSDAKSEFPIAWPDDATYELGEYNVEVREGVPWPG
jgi:hypothetical protein